MTRSVFTKRYDRFRKLLIDARKSAGLSQADVAAKLKRNQTFVSKYERGERRLDVIEFLEVARVLGFDPLKFIRQLVQPDK
ncbi:MAG: helix-turn-helix transcriptional regulator [Planctomycetaceae bacterium]